MEEFGTCPICTEVPEHEIYQCSSGHLICDQCLPKVVDHKCPQCRIKYGATKIRSRVCEKMLDTQRFECKFKERGCTHSTLRGEITSHGNSCAYNPKNTFALCEQWGIKTCNKFRVGCASRKQIVFHFKDVHGVSLNTTTAFTVPGYKIPIKTGIKMNGLNTPKRSFLLGLLTQQYTETSPLFLVLAKFSETVRFLSFLVVQIWHSGSQPETKFNAEFTLNKSSHPWSWLASSSSCSTPPKQTEVFPIGGSMTVCSVKEAVHLINECPVNFPVSLLQRSQFGDCFGDNIHVKITEMGLGSPV